MNEQAREAGDGASDGEGEESWAQNCSQSGRRAGGEFGLFRRTVSTQGFNSFREKVGLEERTIALQAKESGREKASGNGASGRK
jgi:hypothetical protein